MLLYVDATFEHSADTPTLPRRPDAGPRARATCHSLLIPALRAWASDPCGLYRHWMFLKVLDLKKKGKISRLAPPEVKA